MIMNLNENHDPFIPKQERFIRFYEIIKSTDKSILFSLTKKGGGQLIVWLPKSQIQVSISQQGVRMPEWLFDKISS